MTLLKLMIYTQLVFLIMSFIISFLFFIDLPHDRSINDMPVVLGFIMIIMQLSIWKESKRYDR